MKLQSEFYYEGVNDGFLKILFAEWHNILNDFSKRFPYILPYRTYENTNTGLIACAATKLDCLTLQEFTADRNNSGMHKKQFGRGDLFLFTKENIPYVIEAKQMAFFDIETHKALDLISEKLDIVTEQIISMDIKISKIFEKINFLTLIYIVPVLSNASISNNYDLIKNWEKYVLDIKYKYFSSKSFLVYHKRNYETLEPMKGKRNKSYIYPGIIILGNFIER